MKFRERIIYIGAILVLLFLFFNNGCHDTKLIIKRDTKIITKHIPDVDTVIQMDTVLLSKIIHDTEYVFIKPDTIRLYDTVFVYKDYTAKRVYKDTIRVSKSLDIAIIDTLQYNHIISRQTSLIQLEKAKKSNILLHGLVNSDKSFTFGVSYWKQKVGFSVLYNTNKTLGLGVTYKIK